VIRRILALIVICWLLGLAWFVVSLPGAGGAEKTEAVIVLTGGKGRIERGIQQLEAGRAAKMLVSGVNPTVREVELIKIQKAPARLFACCIDLGKQAVDTETNATESAMWLRVHHYRSVRLVTNDWHMPRALFELRRVVEPGTVIVTDSVETAPGLPILFVEYNKLLARRVAAPLGL
jgi:uncharacterized SAM-binding protein YcdF (DUF218 family)